MATYSKEPIAARASELSWLEGRWSGTHGDDSIEEHWSAPVAGTMMGMFRLIREGKVVFFELITIEEEMNGAVMRVKHFSPGLKGWEEKDEAVTLDLVGNDNRLSVWSKKGDESGKWLLYKRHESQLTAWFERAGDSSFAGSRFEYELVID
jgi:hypothetical protein